MGCLRYSVRQYSEESGYATLAGSFEALVRLPSEEHKEVVFFIALNLL
jgi:hypothetical protein